MKKKTLRLISVLAAVLMMLSILSACKKDDGDSKTTGSAVKTSAKVSGATTAKTTGTAAKNTGTGAVSTASTSGSNDPIDETGDPQPGDPTPTPTGQMEVPEPSKDPETGIQKIDVDLEGATLVFAARSAAASAMPKALVFENTQYTQDMLSAAYSKDQAVADGVFGSGYINCRLWADAMRKYNFTAETKTEANHGAVINAVVNNKMAGTFYADVVLANSAAAIPVAADDGHLVAWEDVGFEFDNDIRLNADNFVLTSAKWKGKHYGFVTPKSAEIALFYNVSLFEQYGLMDIHPLVYNNTWNWSAFQEIAIAGTRDVNSDGIPDVWGVIANSAGSAGDAIAMSNGVFPIFYNDQGRVEFMLNTQPGMRALQFYSQLVNSDKCMLTGVNGYNEFIAGKGCMIVGYAAASSQNFVSAGMNFGWAPMPMGPDTNEYKTIRTGADFFAAISGQKYSKVLPYILADAIVTWDTSKEFSISLDQQRETMFSVGSKLMRQADADLGRAIFGTPIMTHSASFKTPNQLIEANIYSNVIKQEITPRTALDTYSAEIQAAINSLCKQ